MTFFRPPVGTEAEEEVGRGPKNSTAAKISKATQRNSIAVSVDGRITVYGRGVVRLKMMGQRFGEGVSGLGGTGNVAHTQDGVIMARWRAET